MKTGTKAIFVVNVPEFIFPGFYETEFDPSNVLYEYTGEEDDYIDKAQDYINTVVGRILDHYRKVLPKGFKLTDGKMDSPKEYNYRNDKIHLKIECKYEDILFHFFNYKGDNLLDYLELDNYHDNFYHEAMLELLLEFWPFDADDIEHEMDLREKFIYG